VRLAKVDATVEKKSGQDYGVRGFPTLYFFLNGEKMDYTGQRSKESMVNWLLKKTRDPVVQIQKE
jgi:protein disulfide-isomerase A1